MYADSEVKQSYSERFSRLEAEDPEVFAKRRIKLESSTTRTRCGEERSDGEGKSGGKRSGRKRRSRCGGKASRRRKGQERLAPQELPRYSVKELEEASNSAWSFLNASMRELVVKNALRKYANDNVQRETIACGCGRVFETRMTRVCRFASNTPRDCQLTSSTRDSDIHE